MGRLGKRERKFLTLGITGSKGRKHCTLHSWLNTVHIARIQRKVSRDEVGGKKDCT